MTKKSKIIWTLIAIVIFTYCFFIENPFQWNLERKRNETSEKYKSLDEFTGEISGIVKESQTSSGWKGVYLFDLSNNAKFSLSGLTRNRNYNYRYVDLRSISVGDSIRKPKDSDTVYVYRKNKEYYYVLGKIIN